MNRTWIITLTVLLIIFLVSCNGQNELLPEATPEEITETTPDSPWQANVPGAAPDFNAEQRESFNIITAFRDPLFVQNMASWMKRMQLNQGGSIILSVVIMFFVAIDYKNLKSRRNIGLLLLLIPSIFLVDLTIFGNTSDAAQARLFSFLYLGLFLSTLVLLIRALMGAFEAQESRWVSNLPTYILIGLTVFLFLVNVMRGLIFRPDDAGFYSNIGAHQMLATGQFPYGNAELRGGAAATYGPVLYLSHIPFQLGLKPITNQFIPGEESFLRKVIIGGDDLYATGPPLMATKLAVISFHFLGVLGLVLLGRQMAKPEVGWGLACLYVSSPYVMGLGGDENMFIGGMAYISHIAPTALTILAFLMIKRPLISGILLAVAAGTLFYPAFLFPLWFGYYFWKRESWPKFTLGFAGAVAVIILFVLLLTNAGPGESVFDVLYESTVGHQEAGGAYGSSTFSFWSTQPGLAALWQKTIIPGVYLLRPSVIVFAIFLGVSFFLVRGRNLPQFAFLTAAVIIAVQLWKSHAGGTYVEWYYPFFLIGLLIPAEASAEEQVPETSHVVGTASVEVPEPSN